MENEIAHICAMENDRRSRGMWLFTALGPPHGRRHTTTISLPLIQQEEKLRHHTQITRTMLSIVGERERFHGSTMQWRESRP